MRYGVIDIGSNSVRLMLSENGITVYKTSRITGLAKGMNETGALVGKNADDTLSAVSFFVGKARADGADEIFVFATSAVRTASNSAEFICRIKDCCGVVVDVVSEETEAEIGYIGALGGNDGGIIDIGGGSTEIQVVKNGVKTYAKSIPVGAVRLADKCGQNEEFLDKYCAERVKEFGTIPCSDFTAIGGTATTAAAMIIGLTEYSAEKIEGFVLSREDLFSLKKKVCEATVGERKNFVGLQPGREEIIGSGLAFLCAVFDILCIKSVKISDKDNLEGYLIRKLYEQTD